MKIVKNTAVFMLGFIATTGVFLLGLVVIGEEFEHAAPSFVDGYFFTWFLVSLFVGLASVRISQRRAP